MPVPSTAMHEVFMKIEGKDFHADDAGEDDDDVSDHAFGSTFDVNLRAGNLHQGS